MKRFTVLLHDDDGELSMEIKDHETMKAITLSAEELRGGSVASVVGLAKIIVKEIKPKFRQLAQKETKES